MLLLCCTAYAEESIPGITKTGNLNVRKSASSASDRVDIIRKKGENVTVLREEVNRKGNKWYYIELKNGRKGYVQAEYIDTEGFAETSGETSHIITFRTSHTGGDDYNNVGDVWTFYYEVNGKQIDRKNGGADCIAGPYRNGLYG